MRVTPLFIPSVEIAQPAAVARDRIRTTAVDVLKLGGSRQLWSHSRGSEVRPS